MEEEVRTTEEEMNRKATLADVEAFGKKIGVFKSGCTYNKFTISLITMINVLYNHTLASDSVNLECLKILVGEPMYVMDELLKVKEAHDNELNARSKKIESARKETERLRLDNKALNKTIHGLFSEDAMNTVLIRGIKTDIDEMIQHGETSFRFMEDLKHYAIESHEKMQRLMNN